MAEQRDNRTKQIGQSSIGGGGENKSAPLSSSSSFLTRASSRLPISFGVSFFGLRLLALLAHGIVAKRLPRAAREYRLPAGRLGWTNAESSKSGLALFPGSETGIQTPNRDHLGPVRSSFFFNCQPSLPSIDRYHGRLVSTRGLTLADDGQTAFFVSSFLRPSIFSSLRRP